MSSIVTIGSNHGILEITLEKRDNQNKTKICSTNNINIIYEFFKKIETNIKKIESIEGCTNIILRNDVCLQISDDIDCSALEVFKPLNEGINYFKKLEQKRKNRFGVTIFAIMFFSIAVGVKINYDVSKDFSKHVKFINGLIDNETDEEIINDNSEDYPEANAFYNFLDERENLKLINRMHAKNLENVNYQEYLPSFGTCSYDSKYLSVIENYGNIVKKMAEISGIDEDIIICVLAQERGIHSTIPDETGAIGVSQIQVNQHLGSTLTLYNVLTGEKESFVVTMELLQNIEGNIKTGVALLQSALIKFDGNILLALQAYNYGEGAVKTVISRTGYTVEEINENFRDLSWMEEVYNYSDKKGGYGDKKYIDNVLSRYPKDELIIIYGENPTTVNLKAMEKVKRILN